MDNCGYFACSADALSCASTIAEMTVDTLLGVAQAASLVASAGVSSAATPAIAAAKGTLKQAIKKAGNQLLSAGVKKSFNAIKNQKKMIVDKTVDLLRSSGVADDTINWAFEKTSRYAKMGKEAAQRAVLSEICNSVADKLIASQPQESNDTGSLADKALDVLLSGAASECKAVSSGKATLNDEIACAKGALTTLSIVDVTGILSIAATFMRPVCGDAPAMFRK